MTDSYLKFANTKFGTKLTSMFGLPQPLPLERQHHDSKAFEGVVLLGGNANSELLPTLAKQLSSIKAEVEMHRSVVSSKDTAWRPDTHVKALIFDATGLNESADSIALYNFFQNTARSLLPHGRVIIIGRRPKKCVSPKKAIVQRSLEGFTRSLAKEFRQGVTAQLVYLDEGARSELITTLRFLLSPRSAYVSGQVINIRRAKTRISKNFDWFKPMAGKKVLITGASQGIGTAIAKVMARDGAEVICLDVPQNEQALNALARRLKGKPLALNLTKEETAAKLVQSAHADGGWDVVVHNAGITRDKTIANMPLEQWESVVNVNLIAQETINHALIDAGALNDKGRIICVSSISGIAGNRGQSNYALSKAGVIGMVESMAPHYAKKGITINAVAPGFIETQMTAAMPFGMRLAGRRFNSLSQGGLPVDVAEAIAWFASPASSGLTANTVRVCGQSWLGA